MTPCHGDVNIGDAIQQEGHWVNHALSKLGNDEVITEDSITWAAYHSRNQQQTNDLPAITALLPLFYKKADTPAMIKHGMDVIREATSFLNPGQLPVITLDQPLFALAKSIQWQWPVEYGEDRFVVMFGGLHLEMAMWSTVGDLLDVSGWTTILTEVEVASSGEAQGLLRASHLTRTSLKQEAYLASANDEPSLADWENAMRRRSPTFLFWDLVMKYETLVLIFVRAHRERNFALFVEVLEQLVPLFFALDHTNYARWVPIHIRDMKSLPESVRCEFQERHHWVLSKTGNKFSSMPLDQAHEQENKMVKGSGGAVGLTENPVAFRSRAFKNHTPVRRPVPPGSGPGQPEELSESRGRLRSAENFHRQVRNLCDVVRRTGNPFLDDFSELVTLDSRDCADVSVVESVKKLDKLGEEQYQKYLKDVIKDRSSSVHNLIKKNNLPLFGKNHKKATSN
ncbi:hypothetical protein ACROYT_G042180 [Oculina patagonica]